MGQAPYLQQQGTTKPIHMKNLTIIAVLTAAALASCGPGNRNRPARPPFHPWKTPWHRCPEAAPPSASTNEQLLQTTFSAFRTAATAGDYTTVEKMIHFPLQTAPKWSDEDLRSSKPDTVTGQITQRQFSTYRDKIFNPEVKVVLEKEGNEEIREIPRGLKMIITSACATDWIVPHRFMKCIINIRRKTAQPKAMSRSSSER